MNPPDAIAWLRFFGVLGLEIFLVAAMACAISPLLKTSWRRRGLWQIALICGLFLVLADVTGFGRGMAAWIVGKPPVEKQFSVRIVPEEQLDPLLPSPVEEVSLVVAPAISTAPTANGSWWPGIVWLAGFLAVMGRMLYARVLLLLLSWRRINVVDSGLRKRVGGITAKLGVHQAPQLTECPGLASPIAFGVVRQTICLPTDFATTFTEAEQDAILAHELAHLAARDPLSYLLADLTSACLWWHPLVWWARRQLHAASELAADEATAVLENGPGTLAECLVKLGRHVMEARAIGSLGVVGFRSQLRTRVERLLNLPEQKKSPRKWPPLCHAMFVLIMIGILVFTSGWMQNRGATGEKNWKSALERSWNNSLGATVLLAAIRSPEPASSRLTGESGKLPVATVPANADLDPGPLLIVKFFLLPPDAIKSVDFKNGPVIWNEKEGGRMLRLWQAKGAQPLKTAQIHTILPARKWTHLSTHRANATGPEDGFLVRARADSNAERTVLDLDLTAGQIEGEYAMPGATTRREITVTIPSQHSAGVYLENNSSATNYLAVFSPSHLTKEEHDRLSGRRLERLDEVMAALGEELERVERRVNQATTETEAERWIAMRNVVKTAMELAYQKASGNRTPQQQIAYLREQLAEAKEKLAKATAAPEKARLTAVAEALERQIVDAVEATLPKPSPTTVDTSPARLKIMTALKSIRIPEAGYDGVPLTEVLKHLADESIKRAPDKVGLNFMINPQSDAIPPIDISSVTVKITPPLRDLRLVDVLDAVISSASQPLHYEVRDYAIVFAPGQPPSALFARNYKVNVARLTNAMQNVPEDSGAPPVGGTFTIPRILDYSSSTGFPSRPLRPMFVTRTNALSAMNNRLRTYFKERGVDFEPPKAVFFNDRQGIVLVRATSNELEQIDDLIRPFIPTPEEKPNTPQIQIKAQFAEVDAAKFDVIEAMIKQGAKFSTNPASRLTAKVDGLTEALKGRLTNALSATITGTLTEPQFRRLTNAFHTGEVGSGAIDIMAAPAITTLAGRQAQVSVHEERTVVTGYSPGSGVNSKPVVESQTIRTGPSLDLRPTVLADGYSIRLEVNATVTEFLGYEGTATDPLPGVLMRQAAATNAVFDGQTLVLTGPIVETILPVSDDPPPAPGLARTGEKRVKKSLVVFVTPTLVDSAGNRAQSK